MHLFTVFREDCGSNSRFPWLNGLWMALWLLLPALGLRAQSYQTSFAEQKYDRAAGAGTLHSGVQIDGATGAMSMRLPLGPGIGARGISYRPELSMRWAPQVTTVVHPEAGPNGTTYWLESKTQEAQATLAPGFLDLRIYDFPGPHFVENYEVAGGISGVTSPRAGQVPNPPPNTGAILAAFGYAGYEVALNPHQEPKNTGLPDPTPFIRVTSDGGLLLGISGPGAPLVRKNMITSTYTQVRTADFDFPSRLLLVKGEAAYEFSFLGEYQEMMYTPFGTGLQTPFPLYQPRFRLTRMLNRVGESINFSYSGGSLPAFEATWMRGGSPLGASVRVAYASPMTTTGSAAVTVTYAGSADPNPSYTIETQDVGLSAGQVYESPEAEWTRLRPLSLTQNFSGERIQWNYAEGARVGYTTWLTGPKVVESVRFPNRLVSLAWNAYKYVRNKAHQDSNAFVPDAIAWAYGVTQATEQALSGGSPDGPSRITRHVRTVPLRAESNVNAGGIPGTWAQSWLSTTFKNVVYRPDGIITVTIYAGPSGVVDPPSTLSGGLLFLKQVVLEERHYTSAQYIENETSPIESSAAFKRVRHSGWDIRCVANPSGDPAATSQPYPTVTETWENQDGVTTLQKQTQSGWNAATFGWSTTTATVSSNGALQSTQATERTYESNTATWFLKRITREQKTVQSDTTGSVVAGTAFPSPLPATLNTFDTTLNTLQTTSFGEPAAPLKVYTTMTYGTSGAERLLPSTITLSGDGLQSGQVGIGSASGGPGYLYDALGHLQSIQQRGASWWVHQTTDVLGRVTSQTDANGNTVTYGYDGAGRLRSIQPSGEQGTVLEYNPDHRGVKVIRGAQMTEYRYNGFGELILERRTNGSVTSYKLFGYNAKGQRTGETVWQSERTAAANEPQWSNPNLVLSTTITTPGYTRCVTWTRDADGNAICTRWVTVPPSTTTTPALYSGTVSKYDDRGRVVQVITPNNESTESVYAGLSVSRKIYARVKGASSPTPLTTTFTRDALNRLVKVVDAKGQVTTYAYDTSGRVLESRQTDPVSGVTQIRNWVYDYLGRLALLDQPESGVTYFTAFTITGKATKVVYGLPRGWRPPNVNQEATSAYAQAGVKVMTYAFDLLGRPQTAVGSGVNQAFYYDNAGGQVQANGKLRRAEDGAIALDYIYGGLSGRLSKLDTKVPGLAVPLTQTFEYDSYGHQTKATTPDGSTNMTYNLAMGLPSLVQRNQSTLVAVPTWDEASWQPLNLSFGNGASTQFTYRADQGSLATLKHLESGAVLKLGWTYQYDESGRLLQDGEDQYQYDELGRLWKATVARLNGAGTLTQAFDYDAFGNPVSSVATGALPASTTPGYNLNNFTLNATERAAQAQANRIPATAGGIPTGASYDAQGNVLTIQKTASSGGALLRMEYDALGRVVSATDVGRQVKEVYQYTPEGLRTVVQAYTGSGYATLSTTRINLYNDRRQLVSQSTLTSGVRTWKRDMIYLGTRQLAEFNGTGMHITHVDHLSSPRLVTNASGKTEGVQKYLPFGETLDQIGFQTGKGFTNHEQTEGDGFIYMQARFYAPQWHRFLSPDPARDQHFEQTQSWNITSYVQNNPTMKIDPTGMRADDLNRPNESLGSGGNVVVDGGGYYSSLNERSEAKKAQTGSDLSAYSGNLGLMSKPLYTNPVTGEQGGIPAQPAVSMRDQQGSPVDASSLNLGGLRPGTVGTPNIGEYRSPRLSNPANPFHAGIDLFAPIGSPVYAAHSGTVGPMHTADTGNAGRYITIQGNGIQSGYVHLSTVLPFKRGAQVDQGAIIGYTGISGNGRSTYAGTPQHHHLHFWVKENGGLINPKDFLERR